MDGLYAMKITAIRQRSIHPQRQLVALQNCAENAVQPTAF
jgi:hypothetical protein